MQNTLTPVVSKSQLREDTERKIAEFLKRGGTVQVLPTRKANAIHAWFVENCQEGRDECQETWVGREQLQALVEVCKQVLSDKKKAAELLPSASGFFFGSTEYDEWYYQDVEYTVTRLEKVLADPALQKCDFYYQSSW